MKSMRFYLIRFIFLLTFLFSVFLLRFNSTAQAPALYDRLGGIHAVASVVDDFIERLLADPIITKNEKVVSAIGRISKPGLKYLVTEFVASATGGPQKYTGRSMKDSHAHLAITQDEWNAAVKDLLATLEKFNVPKKEQDELVAIVATTHDDIVTAKPPAPAPQAPAGAVPTAPAVPPPSQVVPQVPPPAAPEAAIPQVVPEKAIPVVPPPQVLPQIIPEAPTQAVPAAPADVLPQKAPETQPPDVVPQVLQEEGSPSVAPAVADPKSDAPILPPDVEPQVPVQPQTP